MASHIRSQSDSIEKRLLMSAATTNSGFWREGGLRILDIFNGVEEGP